MSNEEQAAAVGRLVMEASECKKRVALLTSDIEALSGALKSASEHINGTLRNIDYPDLSLKIAAIPQPDRVLKALADYKSECERSRQLQERVQSLGL
ncbi:MAG TPA: hypothetical protein VEV17_04830 [Bryobacteraceae bacterium]|nr:hypothetical protein [Bryobacteraceae bacterium]